MNFSYVIKVIIISFVAFIIIYATSVISTQKQLVDSNNYVVKNALKESIDIAAYRVNGEIIIDEEKLIDNVLKNYFKENEINVDNITFEIAIDEDEDIVTVSIYTEKNILESKSEVNYTFSYKVYER